MAKIISLFWRIKTTMQYCTISLNDIYGTQKAAIVHHGFDRYIIIWAFDEMNITQILTIGFETYVNSKSYS